MKTKGIDVKTFLARKRTPASKLSVRASVNAWLQKQGVNPSIDPELAPRSATAVFVSSAMFMQRKAIA